MQCPSCRFENMPNVETCARCGALLVASRAPAAAFMPPRAGSKKAWYPLHSRFNAAVDGYRDWAIWRAFVALAGNGNLPPRSALGYTCLSLFPGLGHLVDGRKRRGAVAFLGWLALVVIAINVFGTSLTGIAIGLLVGWHAVVIFDAGIRRPLDSIRRRWLVLATILALTAIPYFLIHRWVYLEFDLLRIRQADAACGLESEDVVLVDRGSYQLRDLARGDVVVFTPTQSGRVRVRGNLYLALNAHGTLVGRIEALSSETFEISETGLHLEPRSFSSVATARPGVPLPREALKLHVPKGHVLVPVPLQLPRGRIDDSVVEEIWTKMFMVHPGEVTGKVRMIYQPLSRRGPIAAAGQRES